MNTQQEHFRLYDEFRAETREEQKTTGCTCHPQMKNAGHSRAVEFYLEVDEWCPVHGWSKK